MTIMKIKDGYMLLAEECATRYGLGRAEAAEHVAAFLELLRKNGLIDE